MISNLALMRWVIQRRGTALLLSMATGGIILGALSLDLPFWAFCAVGATWGMSAGVSMNMGRTIVQEATPAALRGRTLALYQLGFIGGAPVGALALGLIAGRIGPQASMLVPAIGAGVLIVSLALMSGLTGVRRPQAEAGS